jgi:hypothetical protein
LRYSKRERRDKCGIYGDWMGFHGTEFEILFLEGKQPTQSGKRRDF